MKFKLWYYYDKPGRVKRCSSEVYDKNVKDPDDWGIATLDFFNRTCRPGETHRVFMRTEVLDVNSQAEHDWEKTNLVTVVSKYTSYDTMRCRKCGVTGKRYGIGLQGVVIDPRFKGAVWQRCDTDQKRRKR